MDVDAPTYVSPLANPMIAGKLLERSLKLVKKAAKEKCLRRGVPEVVKAVRKGQKGIMFIAGDIYPLDIAAHVPTYCESKDIAYCYVKSRAVLGAACGSNRAVSAALVFLPKEDSSYTKVYEQVETGVRACHP